MNFAAALQLDSLQYRPPYEQIVNEEIAAQYRVAGEELLEACEASEYLRREFARIRATKRLESLARLRSNWDTYGSEPPARGAVETAWKLVDNCIDEGLMPDGILPSAEGGIAVCFVRNGEYADVEFLNSGEILAVKYGRNEEPIAWGVEKNSGAFYEFIRTVSTHLST